MGGVAHRPEESRLARPSPLLSSSLKRGESARGPSKLKWKQTQSRRAIASSLMASKDEINRDNDKKEKDAGRGLTRKEKCNRKICGKVVKVLELAEDRTVRTRPRDWADFGDDGLLDSINIPKAGADGWSDGSRFSINDAEENNKEGVDVVGVTLGGYGKKPTTVAGKMDDVSLKDKEENSNAGTVAMQKWSNL